jgi:hypothetical protein
MSDSPDFPDELDRLAARLTEYVVLANDPAVPLAAADFWRYSSPHYQAVTGIVERLVQDDAEATGAYRALAGDTATGRHEEPLTRALSAALARRPAEIAATSQAVDRADEGVYVRYHRGGSFDPSAAPLSVADAAALPGLRRRPQQRPDSEVLVVIPLRDTTGGGRFRNFLACVAALRDQGAAGERMTVAAVELDVEPRWRHLAEPVVDHYVFAVHDGGFNRSWAANIGVRHAAPEASYICVLDADILTDSRFIERNLARMRDGGHGAHLPFELLTTMDQPSSDRAIRHRCEQGHPDVPAEQVRALQLRDVPGACVWVRRDFYERLGGHDERFEGWGGEDDDLLARMEANGRVTRFPDQTLHMYHPRPSMVRPDGRPYNAHIPPLSWTAAHGFGRLTGPVRIPA